MLGDEIILSFRVWATIACLLAGGSLSLWVLARRAERARVLAAVILGAFTIRVALALAMFCVSYFRLPLWEGMQAEPGFWKFSLDALPYHLYGRDIAESWRLGIELPFPGVGVMYCMIVAGIYNALGAHPLYPILMNSWLCALIALLAYRIGRRFFSQTAARISAVLVGFWPSSMLWSTQLLKEPVSWFLIMMSIWIVVERISPDRKDRGIRSLTLSFASLLALGAAVAVLTQLRHYMGSLVFFSAAAVLIPSGIVALRHKRYRICLRYLLIVSMVCFSGVWARSVNVFDLLTPAHPEIGNYRLGASHWRKGDLEQAAHYLSQAIYFNDEYRAALAADGEVMTEYGGELEEKGELEAAIRAYERALHHYGRYLELELEEDAARREHARVAMALVARDLAALTVSRARDLVERGEREAAVHAYEKSLHHYGRYLELEEDAARREHARKAISSATNELAEMYVFQARASVKQNERKVGLKVFGKALASYGRYCQMEADAAKRADTWKIMAHIHAEIASIYLVVALPVDAQAAYERAISMEPSIAAETVELAFAIDRARHFARAHEGNMGDIEKPEDVERYWRDRWGKKKPPAVLGLRELAWLELPFGQPEDRFREPASAESAVPTASQSAPVITADASVAGPVEAVVKEGGQVGPVRVALNNLTRIGVGPSRLWKVAMHALTEVRPKRLADARWNFISAGGASVIDAGDRPTTILELAGYWPRAMAVGFLKPFPWEWRVERQFGMTRMAALVDTSVIFLLIPCMLFGAGLLAWQRRPDALFVLMFCLLAASAVSIAVANLGTLFRLRLLYLFPLLSITGGGVVAVTSLLERIPGFSRRPRKAPVSPAAPPAVRRPVRVLRIMTRLNIGGPAVHAKLLSTRLDASRFSTCLVVGEPSASEGDMTQHIEKARGARVIRMRSLRRPIRPWADCVTLVRLLRLLWRERPGIIHTHMAKAGALGRLAGLLYNAIGPGRLPGSRAALIHTFHGHVLEGYFHPWVSGLFAWIERQLARGTDCLIAVSPAVRQSLLDHRIGRPEQIRVIPLGLDLTELSQLPPPEPAEPVRCGMMGRLVPIKNPGLFLEGIQRVLARAPDAIQGVIVGDGPIRGELEAQAHERGLSGAVQFTGWRQDLLECYRNLDAVCLTSWNEGTPVSLIEAMAAGRAVVATDVGGVRDLLGNGCTDHKIEVGAFQVAERGLLVRPGDAEGLASALGALAEDPVLRRKLGQAGRLHAVSKFASERLVKDMCSLYSELTREE